VRKQPLIGSRI